MSRFIDDLIKTEISCNLININTTRIVNVTYQPIRVSGIKITNQYRNIKRSIINVIMVSSKFILKTLKASVVCLGDL